MPTTKTTTIAAVAMAAIIRESEGEMQRVPTTT
jgi:hypothetical protein